MKKLLLILLIALMPMVAHGKEVVVKKSDGTSSSYKFLPVHYDPNHAIEVENRFSPEMLFTTPSSYDIPSSMIPAVRDQGQRGTCAYFATMAITESYYMRESSSNASINLSEECLVDIRNWEFDQGVKYTGSDKPDQRPDPNGDLPNSIVKTIENLGVPAEAKYDSANCMYDGSNSNGGSVNPVAYVAVFSVSPAYGKGLTYDVNASPTIDSLKALISSNVPVEIGIIVYNEYMNKTDWRYNAKIDVDSNIAGGHAIILTGYKTSGKKTIFTFKNSWGANWGKSGYGTMDDAILTHSWGYDPNFDFIVSLHGSSSESLAKAKGHVKIIE